MKPLAPTRLAALDRRHAAFVVLALAAAIGICVAVAPATWMPSRPASAPNPASNDFDLYAAILARLRAGEPYHHALGAELRARDYPTASVFNWRTPAHLCFLAAFPSDGAIQLALGLLALLACCAAFGAIARDGGFVAATLAALVLASGFVTLAFARAFLVAEMVAGMLVAASAALLALEKPPARAAGIAAGLAALFVRELALPYVLVRLAVALRERRIREAAAWCIGLSLFGLSLAAHAAAVREQSVTTVAAASSWLRFGGLPFVVNTVRAHPALLDLPAAVAGVALPLSLFGLLAARGEFAAIARATAIVYCLAFSIAGQPFNSYWGWLDSPLLLCGLAYTPSAMRDLARSLSRA